MGNLNFCTTELRNCIFGTDFQNFSNFGRCRFDTTLSSAPKCEFGTKLINFDTSNFDTKLCSAPKCVFGTRFINFGTSKFDTPNRVRG